MGRKYPNRRRRRPGRRPPNRYSGRHEHRQFQGFTPFGLRQFYRILLPGLQGREKREYFNEIAGWMVLGVAIGGGMIGYFSLGPLGVIFGLGAGAAAGGALVEKARFYRP
jgi:hypothetical protein